MTDLSTVRLEVPRHVDAGLVPGGLVFHTYRYRQGEPPVLLFEHRIGAKERPDDLEFPDELDMLPTDRFALVVYDGDTGDVSWLMGLSHDQLEAEVVDGWAEKDTEDAPD